MGLALTDILYLGYSSGLFIISAPWLISCQPWLCILSTIRLISCQPWCWYPLGPMADILSALADILSSLWLISYQPWLISFQPYSWYPVMSALWLISSQPKVLAALYHWSLVQMNILTDEDCSPADLIDVLISSRCRDEIILIYRSCISRFNT